METNNIIIIILSVCLFISIVVIYRLKNKKSDVPVCPTCPNNPDCPVCPKPDCPTCPDKPDCPDCPVCPKPDCPDCPTCPSPAPCPKLDPTKDQCQKLYPTTMDECSSFINQQSCDSFININNCDKKNPITCDRTPSYCKSCLPEKSDDWVTQQCTLTCTYPTEINQDKQPQFNQMRLYMCSQDVVKKNVPNIQLPANVNVLYSDYFVPKYDSAGPVFTTSNGNKYFYRQYINPGDKITCINGY